MAEWLMAIAGERSGATFELVDLADYHLPFLGHTPDTPDEETPPVERWTALIDRLDGYVFVTPEYNHSPSAVLKNALDLVGNAQWGNKPAGLVSYGGRAGGARAAEHLRQILGELRVFDVREQVTIPNFRQYMAPDGTFDVTESIITSANAMLDEVAFWAVQMRAARRILMASATR